MKTITLGFALFIAGILLNLVGAALHFSPLMIVAAFLLGYGLSIIHWHEPD